MEFTAQSIRLCAVAAWSTVVTLLGTTRSIERQKAVEHRSTRPLITSSARGMRVSDAPSHGNAGLLALPSALFFLPSGVWPGQRQKRVFSIRSMRVLMPLSVAARRNSSVNALTLGSSPTVAIISAAVLYESPCIGSEISIHRRRGN